MVSVWGSLRQVCAPLRVREVIVAGEGVAGIGFSDTPRGIRGEVGHRGLKGRGAGATYLSSLGGCAGGESRNAGETKRDHEGVGRAKGGGGKKERKITTHESFLLSGKSWKLVRHPVELSKKQGTGTGCFYKRRQILKREIERRGGRSPWSRKN